jgi:hypothetical protein
MRKWRNIIRTWFFVMIKIRDVLFFYWDSAGFFYHLETDDFLQQTGNKHKVFIQKLVPLKFWISRYYCSLDIRLYVSRVGLTRIDKYIDKRRCLGWYIVKFLQSLMSATIICITHLTIWVSEYKKSYKIGRKHSDMFFICDKILKNFKNKNVKLNWQHLATF